MGKIEGMDTQARIEAAKARLDENKAALVSARSAGPPCTKCAYYVPTYNNDPLKKGYKPSYCTHPAYRKTGFNPLDGKVVESGFVFAYAARSSDGLCGIEGILFERRPLFLFTLLKDWRISLFLLFVAFWIGVLTIRL